MHRRIVTRLWIVVFVVLLVVPTAEAGIVRGVQRIVAGAFALPLNIIQGTFSGPPVVGTLMGAVNGTFQTVSLVTGGAFEMVAGAIPLAKAAAPYVLPFLFL